jgi:uncharacterized tellurite resistance protein B-like protein
MPIIIALGVLIVVIWFLRAGRRTSSQPASTPQASREGQTNPAPLRRDISILQTKPLKVEGGWLTQGREVTVSGYLLRGGLLYVGSGLRSVAGHRVEPALIDPALPVDRTNPDRAGAGMGYWPSYSSIPPQCRAAYLEWLAAGRRNPDACIGYVFLYFYGLERRALAEAPRSDEARRELSAIVSEVQALLAIYGNNRSFRRYATQLVDVVNALDSSGREGDAQNLVPSSDLTISLRVGLGRFAADGKPLPADWAMRWLLLEAPSLPTAARRCVDEFGQLFRIRYVREYGEGLQLKSKRSKLSISLTPASATFGGAVDVELNIPDVTGLTAPLAKLHSIGETCASDLDAFSRWIGRNPDSPRNIAAVALLPPELARDCDSQEAKGLWAWIESTIERRDIVLCRADDLLARCTSFGQGKLARSEAVLLAQLLETGGYGIEPDVRFGGAPIAPGGSVVLFTLAAGSPTIASPSYAAATILLHLAVAVSAADGSISESEEHHVREHLEKGLSLSAGEQRRLSAHLAWLIASPPSLTGLKKRLAPLDPRQRSGIADFIIGVAGADGLISSDEIKTLGKVYPMLGIDSDEVYRNVHAMAAGAGTSNSGTDPVTISSASRVRDFTVPPAPGNEPSVRLDMVAVNAKLAESAQLSAILDDIFNGDEADASVRPVAPVAPRSTKVPSSHVALLSRLVDRPEWSRADFEALASELRLLPDGAIDTLNEVAFEHTGGPVLEGDDPIEIELTTAKELLL